MSSSLFADCYISYDYTDYFLNDNLRTVENSKKLGDLNEGDLIYYCNDTYIGKAYLRYYPLHKRAKDENGIIKKFKIIVTYVFSNENGKEDRYKRDVVIGSINYDDFRNSTFFTTGGEIDDWRIEVYSSDLNALKELMKEKVNKHIEHLKDEIVKINHEYNETIKKLENELKSL